ncbi:hypothetical protein [Paraburkholderia dinghuensis]|uniref:Uncharacterized protein n=1 Tax=Paraburkholderia dinghuensis TaxID=2305225 RepID=A0A3N6N3G1_9BURK|nr:hypothetical protein [Paraburkholderia dinghuensis]RQH09085.1 hypothetical protein D1Y85_04270 [Paraburkholderia dinghuensis]
METPRPPVFTFTKSLFAALIEHVSVSELATALRELPRSTCARLLRLVVEGDAEHVGHIVIHAYNQVIVAKEKAVARRGGGTVAHRNDQRHRAASPYGSRRRGRLSVAVDVTTLANDALTARAASAAQNLSMHNATDGRA